MAISRSQEIRVGVVAVLALIILIGGIVWGKGGGFGIGLVERSIQISFDNASGVDVGTPITVKGVRKGAVTGLDVRSDEVRITATVESGVPLHRDAAASLQMLEVTGGKKIEISSGASADPLPAGAVIPGTVQGDISALLADVGEIGGRAKVLLQRLDSTMQSVNAMLGSPQFQSGLKNTLANLEATSQTAREIAVGNREAIERTVANIDRATSDLRELVSRTRPSVDRMLVTAEGAATDARQAILHVDSTLYRVDNLLAGLDSIATDVRSGGGAVSKLLYDKQFASQLDSTLNAVQLLIKDIERSGIRTRINIGFGD